jgi:hypothetical protein
MPQPLSTKARNSLHTVDKGCGEAKGGTTAANKVSLLITADTADPESIFCSVTFCMYLFVLTNKLLQKHALASFGWHFHHWPPDVMVSIGL